MGKNKDENKRFNNRNKKINKKKMAIIISLSVLAIIIGTVAFGYQYVKSRIYVAPSNIAKNQEAKYKEVEGITNVLLIGTDGRTLDEASRSDSIIIATLDNNNKKVKLTSIMRDTLVDIPEYGEQKINAAFAFGGPELLMETISNTFEINLDKYIIVNFWGFEAIIDAIGGIEVEIKDYEIENINEYIGESTETQAEPITKPGLQKLNGAQALSYSRIRSAGNGSYERTERQRRVLYEIATNLKKVNPLKYPSIADELSAHVRTNIDPLMALNYGYTIYKFPELNFEQLQIPNSELVDDRLYKDRGWVLLIDKKQNAKILHDFIFEDKLPNEDEFDYAARDSVFAAYRADEERYNSLYGINPEEHEEVGDTVTDKDIQNNNSKPVEQPPATGGGTTSGTTTPGTGGGTTTPGTGGGTTTPGTGGGTTTPGTGGGTTTPGTGGGTTTPGTGGGTTTPGTGGGTTIPGTGEGTTTPGTGEGTTTPGTGEGTTTPGTDGGATPGTSGVSTPVEG